MTTVGEFLYGKPRETIKKTNRIFIIAYAIFIYYFLINGRALLPYFDDSWISATIFYMIGVSMTLNAVEDLPDKIRVHWKDVSIGFIVMFLLCTVVIFAALRDLNIIFVGIVPMKGYQVISHLVFQIGIVATAEELIFRGAIVSELEKHTAPIGVYLISSFLFSIFHLAAYGPNISSLFIIFIFGLILCYLTRKMNIGWAIGLHAAWNLFLIGATTLL